MTLSLEQQTELIDYPFPIGPLGTPPKTIAWARKHRPLCPIRLPSGTPAWMLTRKQDIAMVLSDRRFSRNLTFHGAPRFVGEDFTAVPGGIFNLDPPDHTRVRQVIGPFYTRAGAERYRPLIERHAQSLLDAMAAGSNPVDLMQAYSNLLPLHSNCDILQVPVEFRARYLEYFHTQTNYEASAEEVAQATAQVIDFARRVIELRRDQPHHDDPIGALIQAEREGRISEQELVGTVCYLFVTGSEPLIPPLSTGLLTLLVHPQQLRQCIDDPALWPRAVEEVLRYHHNGVLGLPRVATEDVTVGDGLIRRGEAVCATMLGVTWDPKYYRHPEKFDIHRDTDGTATFGSGPHFCLGSSLTRVFLESAYRLLFERFPRLALALPASEIPWERNILFIRPVSLPVAW
ncbi:cytochrome P450 [Lysobacter firmicutimachus]|uniref:Cytochrome P450 n=1 Tax=Lysobacter firmicutimachus TaxID=1792846 RepID=A0ABU8CYA9_9GAMM